MMSAVSGLDWPEHGHWFRAVNDFARNTPWLHAVFRDYAEYGVVLFGALLLLSWWLARSSGDLRKVAAASWAPLGVLVAVGLNQPIANAVGEPRPYTALPHVEVLVARSSDYSFASDHAVMAGAVAAGILLCHRWLGLITLGAALLMCFARVYVGAHYPHDVVVGLLFGMAVAVVTERVTRGLTVWCVELVASTRLRLLVLPGKMEVP